MPPRDDTPHPSGDDRYAIYVVTNNVHHRLAETSLEGIGLTVETLREDGDIEPGTRVGVFDREKREWLISPW